MESKIKDAIRKNVTTLAANMRNAFVERKGATIGGGKFTPEELRDGAIALQALPELLDALKAMCVEFRALDLPYGSKAYAAANEVINSIGESSHVL